MSDPNNRLIYAEYVRQFKELATFIGLNAQFISREMNWYESMKEQFHPVWFHYGVAYDIVDIIWNRFCDLYYDESKNDLAPPFDNLKFSAFLSEMGWTHKRARKIAPKYLSMNPVWYLVIAIYEVEKGEQELKHKHHQQYLALHPDAQCVCSNWYYPYSPPSLDEFRMSHRGIFSRYMTGRYK